MAGVRQCKRRPLRVSSEAAVLRAQSGPQGTFGNVPGRSCLSRRGRGWGLLLALGGRGWGRRWTPYVHRTPPSKDSRCPEGSRGQVERPWFSCLSYKWSRRKLTRPLLHPDAVMADLRPGSRPGQAPRGLLGAPSGTLQSSSFSHVVTPALMWGRGSLRRPS